VGAIIEAFRKDRSGINHQDLLRQNYQTGISLKTKGEAEVTKVPKAEMTLKGAQGTKKLREI